MLGQEPISDSASTMVTIGMVWSRIDEEEVCA